MNRLIAEVISSGKMTFRSKIAVFFTLIFPVLLILIFGAIFSGQGSSAITLQVQNLDEGPLSEELINILNATRIVKVEYIPSSENITEYIRNHSLYVALKIPEGFTSDVQQLLNDPNVTFPIGLTIYGDPSNQGFMTAQAAVNGAITYMNYNLSGAFPLISVITSTVTLEELEFIDFFLPGIIGFTIMTSGLFGMTSQCAEYRSRGFFKLLATTTLTKWEWLISMFIINTLIVTVSLLLMVIVGILAYDIAVTLTLLTFVFVMIGVLLFTGMGMLIGTVIKDPESGTALANAIGFPMMFLSGVFFPIESFPSYLQTVADFLPLTYLANGLRDTMIFGNTTGALSNLFILSVLAVIFVILGSKLMSWKEK